MIEYKNPTPVVVVVFKIKATHDYSMRSAVLLIERAIDPHIGKLALPGGYINEGETAEIAASRELHEETGIMVYPDELVPFRTEITQDNKLLVFVRLKREIALGHDILKDFIPNEEVSRLCFVDIVEYMKMPKNTIAFPLHENVINKVIQE